MRILVAEDNLDLNRIIEKKLSAEGYAVDVCFDGLSALDFFSMADYDAAILDIMMPKLDGLTVVKKLREQNNITPIIFLTAKDTLEDKVKGLDIGANDYLVKPFAFEELLARIRVLTRNTANNATNLFTIADLSLDVESRIVKRSGNEISLTAREFSILEYLLRNKGKVVSRKKIEDNVWNFDYEGGTNVVDVYINYLRKKVDENYEPKLIHTVRGVGYILKELK